MARRPIFVPNNNGFPFVTEIPIEFDWYPGFSKVQAQKSILSLHNAASKKGIYPSLEISSKSPNELGVSLSAFNLTLKTQTSEQLSVECAFQGSKVFQNGGPYRDLYNKSSREAKTDERLRSSGELIGFDFMGNTFPLKPITAFYDWLYMMALQHNQEHAQKLFAFQGFTDIAFNPEKSINCQARSAAMYVSISNALENDIGEIIKNKNSYLDLVSGKKTQPLGPPQQLTFDL